MNADLDRVLRRALILIALTALTVGAGFWLLDKPALAQWIWAAGTVPVILGLAVSMVRDLLAGRFGVDAVAFLSMTGALALRENLAAIVVAVMYAGGTVLEDFAVARAERDLKALVDRAPRVAHRSSAGQVEDIPVADVAIGDRLLVRAGEVVPVDGVLADSDAILDEAALSGEPIPVARLRGRRCAAARSTRVKPFLSRRRRLKERALTRASSGWRRRRKRPSLRPFDLPTDSPCCCCRLRWESPTFAWLISGDPKRALAVLVAATPCPLILAAPVAYIAGVARAARRGILMKGGAALEALAGTQTVMFDKTGTLTVGGARIIGIETAPGWSADETLRAAASLEQASQHVVAAAIVAAARERQLSIEAPRDVREAMGSGLEGDVKGHRIRAGSHAFVFDSSPRALGRDEFFATHPFAPRLPCLSSSMGFQRGRFCSPINCVAKPRERSRRCEPRASRGSSWSPAIAPRQRRR